MAGILMAGSVLGKAAWNPSMLSNFVASPTFSLMRAANKIWQDTGMTTLALNNGDTISAFQCTFSGKTWIVNSNPGTLYDEGSGKWSLQCSNASNSNYNNATIASITSHATRCMDTGNTFIATIGCSNNDKQNFRLSTDDGWSRNTEDLATPGSIYVNGVNTDSSAGQNVFQTVMGSSASGSQTLPGSVYEIAYNSSQGRQWVGRIANVTLTDAVFSSTDRANLKSFLDALA